jgi:hypothetical protein
MSSNLEKQNALLHRALITSSIENAVRANPRVKPTALPDVINKAVTVFTVVETGQGNVKLVPKIGLTVLYGPDGTTPHSPDSWLEEQITPSPHWFQETNNSASRARSAPMTDAEFFSTTPEQKLALEGERSKHNPANRH